MIDLPLRYHRLVLPLWLPSVIMLYSTELGTEISPLWLSSTHICNSFSDWLQIDTDMITVPQCTINIHSGTCRVWSETAEYGFNQNEITAQSSKLPQSVILQGLYIREVIHFLKLEFHAYSTSSEFPRSLWEVIRSLTVTSRILSMWGCIPHS